MISNSNRNTIKVLAGSGVCSFVSDNGLWSSVATYHLLRQFNPKGSFRDNKSQIIARISKLYNFSESTVTRFINDAIKVGFLELYNKKYRTCSFKTFAKILGVDIDSEDNPTVIFKFDKSLLSYSKSFCAGKFSVLKDFVRDLYFGATIQNNKKQQKDQEIKKQKRENHENNLNILRGNSEKLKKGEQNPFAIQNSKKAAKIIKKMCQESEIVKFYSDFRNIRENYSFDFNISRSKLSEILGMGETSVSRILKKSNLFSYSARKIEISGNYFVKRYVELSGFGTENRDYSLSFDQKAGKMYRTITNKITLSDSFSSMLKKVYVKRLNVAV